MDDTVTSSQTNLNGLMEDNNKESLTQTTADMEHPSESSPLDKIQTTGDSSEDAFAKEMNNQSTPPEEIILQNGSGDARKETRGQRQSDKTENKPEIENVNPAEKEDTKDGGADIQLGTEMEEQTSAREGDPVQSESADKDESKGHEDKDESQERTDKGGSAIRDRAEEGDMDQKTEGKDESKDHVVCDKDGDNTSTHSGNTTAGDSHNQSVSEHIESITTQDSSPDKDSYHAENINTEHPRNVSIVEKDTGAEITGSAQNSVQEDLQLTQRSEEEREDSDTEDEDTSQPGESDLGDEHHGDITQRSQQGDTKQITDDTKLSEDGDNKEDAGDVTARSQQGNEDTTTAMGDNRREDADGGNFTLSSQKEDMDSSRDVTRDEEDVYLETYRRESHREGYDEEERDDNVDNQHPEGSLTEQDTEEMDDVHNQHHKEDAKQEVEEEDEPTVTEDDEEEQEQPQAGAETEEEPSTRYEPQDHSHMKEDNELQKQEEQDEDDTPGTNNMEEVREKEEFSKKLDSVEDGSLTVTERLELITEMLDAERAHLLETPLKDYDRLERLNSVIHSSKVVCGDYEYTMLQMSDKINQVSQVINAINGTVERKITNEGVLSWAEQLKTDPSDPESVAREKNILSQAAESREALGKASCEIARAEERAAELTVQTVEAALTATKAQQAAEEARAAAEVAKKAAEQRRLEKEEAKHKEDEAKRRREEMERLRREEEERKKLEEELLTDGTPEERERIRREVERRDPKNWPVWVFSVDPGSTSTPVGCVIRCLPDVTSRNLFTVEKIDQLSGILSLEPNEELVSNIIRVTHEDPNFKTIEPLCIAVPHCAPRINSRECVLKMMQPNGKWVEVGTSDAMFEDMREYKFCECRLQKIATLAVVTRIKKEQHTVHKRGGKVVPSVDTRICFTVRQSMFKVSTTATVEVFPVDSTLVADLRYRKEHCEGLLTSSPMVRFITPLRKFSKPVMVNIPLPQNPANQKRPSTAAANKSTSGGNEGQAKGRPSTAFMAAYAKHEEEEEDQVHLLTKDNEGEWTVLEGVHLVQPKNKDIITFEMDQPLRKFLILRCKPDVTFTGLERIAAMMEEVYTERVVQFVLRQKDDDASSVTVHCAPVPKIEGIVRRLGEKGYSYGPMPSQDIVLHEGQAIRMTFRGNVMGEEPEQNSKSFVYNTHIKTIQTFRVAVKDTFAQKSIECYRGFCQISLPTGETKPDDMSTSVYLKKQLQTELLINLPKPEPEAPKAIVERAPVQVKTDGLINKDLLQQVAADLGEEWKRLAQQLNIKRMRIQAIIRNNVQKDTEHVIYEMLLTWMKRVPKSANKVEMLCNALLAIGRVDIAEVIRDKELDFKKEKALSHRDSYLRKAFVQIAQSPYIVSDWKFLGRQLEVREMDLAEVDDSYTSMREKCFHSLIRWREVYSMEATPALLIDTLRKCKYHHVADQVQETLKNAV